MDLVVTEPVERAQAVVGLAALAPRLLQLGLEYLLQTDLGQ
jgi:hypothetical protein